MAECLLQPSGSQREEGNGERELNAQFVPKFAEGFPIFFHRLISYSGKPSVPKKNPSAGPGGPWPAARRGRPRDARPQRPLRREGAGRACALGAGARTRPGKHAPGPRAAAGHARLCGPEPGRGAGAASGLPGQGAARAGSHRTEIADPLVPRWPPGRLLRECARTEPRNLAAPAALIPRRAVRLVARARAPLPCPLSRTSAPFCLGPCLGALTPGSRLGPRGSCARTPPPP